MSIVQVLLGLVITVECSNVLMAPAVHQPRSISRSYLQDLEAEAAARSARDSIFHVAKEEQITKGHDSTVGLVLLQGVVAEDPEHFESLCNLAIGCVTLLTTYIAHSSWQGFSPNQTCSTLAPSLKWHTA